MTDDRMCASWEGCHSAALDDSEFCAFHVDRRPCGWPGGCDVAAVDDERLCAFHVELDERSALMDAKWFIPRKKDTLWLWDGFQGGEGRWRPPGKLRERRLARRRRILWLRKTTPTRWPRSRVADVVEAAVAHPDGIVVAVPSGENPSKYCALLRGRFRQIRETCRGRWSVRLTTGSVHANGSIHVRLLGMHDGFTELIDPTWKRRRPRLGIERESESEAIA